MKSKQHRTDMAGVYTWTGPHPRRDGPIYIDVFGQDNYTIFGHLVRKTNRQSWDSARFVIGDCLKQTNLVKNGVLEIFIGDLNGWMPVYTLPHRKDWSYA